MSSNMKTRHSSAFKVKVVLESYKEEKTSAELTSLYQVYPSLIRKWRTILVKNAPEIFNGNSHSDKDQAELIETLYKKIVTKI